MRRVGWLVIAAGLACSAPTGKQGTGTGFSTDRAVLYHSTGDGQWTALKPSPLNAVNRIDIIWGFSASDVYMGGYSDPNRAGAILHGTPN